MTDTGSRQVEAIPRAVAAETGLHARPGDIVCAEPIRALRIRTVHLRVTLPDLWRFLGK
jgi:hypothetical protein